MGRMIFMRPTEEQERLVRDVFEAHQERFDYVNFDLIGIQIASADNPPKWKARIKKVSPEYSMYVPYSYILQIYRYTFLLPEEDFEATIYHELLHIPLDMVSSPVDHDIEDFKEIYEVFGKFIATTWGDGDLEINKEKDVDERQEEFEEDSQEGDFREQVGYEGDSKEERTED